jgi:hypothetical protein
VVLGVVCLAVFIVLVVAAFNSSVPPFQESLPKGSLGNPNGPPLALIVATQGVLHLQLPVNQAAVTALGYHGTDGTSLPLQPIGRQANEGVLARIVHSLFGGGGSGPTYYELGGGQGSGTSALDVGAPAGTDVYSPVDGTVVSIGNFVLNGQSYGNTLEIQPSQEASSVVVVTRLRADPALTVGEPVMTGRSKIGSVIDLSGVEKQTLARVTHDAGNHVTVEVKPAPSIPIR